MTDRSGAVAGIVLAAGAGRRFGVAKALVELDGELFVERAVRTLDDAGCDPIIVVLGASADDVVECARLEGSVVVVSERWHEGMAASLRTGLGRVADTTAAAAVVVLVDQPWLGPDVVVRLVDRWRSGAVVAAASFGGGAQNPVVFDRSVWSEVAAVVSGDTGARAWLKAHSERVARVDCRDIGDPRDVDVPADLRR